MTAAQLSEHVVDDVNHGELPAGQGANTAMPGTTGPMQSAAERKDSTARSSRRRM